MTDNLKMIVITGGSDGIGAAAARQLNADGHEVVIVGRSPEKTRAVASELDIRHHICDFARLDEVRQLAADLDSTCERIDVLANNAGGVFGDRAKTIDGFEKTFQVNHLAAFLLTKLLMDRLIRSGASVIHTSTVGARMTGKLVIDDLNHDRDFSATRAYGTAKLENILFTKKLHWRYADQGISAAAFHPGSVATSFGKESDSVLRFISNNPVARKLMGTAEKGASQLVWLAEGVPGKDWQPGGYYEKYKLARRNNKQALDADLARELWERSDELVATG